MRFHCGPSKEERQKAQLVKTQAEAKLLQKWTPWFAWRPVRVGEDDCRFMETVERRYRLAHACKFNSGRVELVRCLPEYRAVAWPEDGM